MARPIPKSTFAGGITTLHIGPKRFVFEVHTELLTWKSPYFAEVLSNQRDKNGSPIELATENPNIFHLLVNWLYHQRIISSSFCFSAPDWQDLIHLWLLADRVQMQALQNDVISCCRQKIDLQGNNDLNSKAVCPLDIIAYAYKHTSAGSPLRQVITEAWVANSRHVKDPGQLVSKFPTEFLQDICVAFVKATQGTEERNDEPEEAPKEEAANDSVVEEGSRRREEKEPAPVPAGQPAVEIEPNGTQYELPVETAAPVPPVVDSSGQSSDHLFEPDTGIITNGQQEEKPAYIPRESSQAANGLEIDSSNQSVSSNSNKKNNKTKDMNNNNNKKDGTGYPRNIPAPDVSEQQAGGSPEQNVVGVNGNNNNNKNVSHHPQGTKQQQPGYGESEARVNSYQDHLPKYPSKDKRDASDSNNHPQAPSEFVSKKYDKQKNKKSRLPNGHHGPIPTGPQADMDTNAQNELHWPAPQSPQATSHSRQNSNSEPYKQYNNKHNKHNQYNQYNQHQNSQPSPMANGPKGPYPKYGNGKKQKMTSRLDPAVQSPEQPMRNGKFNKYSKRK